MLTKLLIAWGLMAVCVAIHASGVTLALRWWRGTSVPAQQFWSWTLLFIRIAAWVLIHLLEIAVWAAFYFLTRAMPDLQSALYFSGVTYTTTGYARTKAVQP